MRLGISNARNSENYGSESVGNQKREATGISGTKYDFSYMNSMSEAAGNGLGENQCVLSMANMVSRTSINVDTRSAAEKMFSTGESSNFKFSVYFDKDLKDQAIEANNHMDRRLQYELELIKSMIPEEYEKSINDMIKMAAVRKAKQILSLEDISSITQTEWERALIENNAKAKQFGLSTFELAVRASTRDVSLRRNNSNAWLVTEAGYEAATYNAAGTKTLPLFNEEQIKKARTVSEKIYREFEPMYSYALSNTSDYSGMFEQFCNVAINIDRDVPKRWEPNYVIWTAKQMDEIDQLGQRIANSIIGG